jgi:4-hydroxybenzoyl-CoA reductase subunit gamma
MKRELTLRINGREQQVDVPTHHTLLEVPRAELDLVGAREGCGVGMCGACTVLLDGQPRLACLTLAASCDGRRIQTIESLAGPDGRVGPLQQAFHERLGAQCGFCTPGMVMSAEALLRANPRPTEAEIRDALAGNLCRCTGYVKIVEAVQCAAASAGEA